jgi:hypothetical protein
VHPLREACRVKLPIRIVVWAVALVGLFVLVPRLMAGDEPPPAVQMIDRTVDGLNVDDWKLEAERWHSAAARYLNRSRQLKRAIRFDPEVKTAIDLACVVYGNCSTLWRKAGCETGGTFSRWSKNRHSTASGLFQFLDSTWTSTPYGGFSVYDPYANALAAGWMHVHNRGGEWVCR